MNYALNYNFNENLEIENEIEITQQFIENKLEIYKQELEEIIEHLENKDIVKEKKRIEEELLKCEKLKYENEELMKLKNEEDQIITDYKIRFIYPLLDRYVDHFIR